ncbi:hypothetical protein B0O99DRAFT_577743 [Bisporella sp. PMI_857]|nr:hypothetical protein B0O99DRAFT_577743 [Bisporella sp. PMI_857]
MAAHANDAESTGNNGASQKISLEQRAPTGPIATRTWNIYLHYGMNLVAYGALLEQKDQCIRSRLARKKFDAHVGEGGLPVTAQAFNESTTYPYSTAFQKILREQSRRQVQAQVHDEENSVGVGPRGQVQTSRDEWHFGLTTRWFGITRTSVIKFETQVQPVYLDLGIFPRGHSSPRERIVFIDKPKQLFRKLRWAVFRLRGLRSTFFSLRHVKGFRLYRCNADNRTHERIDLDSNGIADLQLLLDTYKNWHVPNYITLAWANWIHQSLNGSSHNVLKGTYALELVLDWSATRISIIVLLPVLLSLAIGLWLNSSDWTDLATIQTAWGTASYVVTAGGLLAALLGILSGIADK